jgi:hypothetical protein
LRTGCSNLTLRTWLTGRTGCASHSGGRAAFGAGIPNLTPRTGNAGTASGSGRTSQRRALRARVSD